VRGLADSVLPLFAAAAHGRPRPEIVEPLAPMRACAEVVEDYRSTGLSLRCHPVAFLRPALAARRMVACADLAHARDGRRVAVPGLVLVRQKPGSGQGRHVHHGRGRDRGSMCWSDYRVGRCGHADPRSRCGLVSNHRRNRSVGNENLPSPDQRRIHA